MIRIVDAFGAPVTEPQGKSAPKQLDQADTRR
jgi:hypothetical protein